MPKVALEEGPLLGAEPTFGRSAMSVMPPIPGRALFDHLVGTGEQRRRKCEVENLSRLQIEDQFNFDRLHHRQARGAPFRTGPCRWRCHRQRPAWSAEVPAAFQRFEVLSVIFARRNSIGFVAVAVGRNQHRRLVISFPAAVKDQSHEAESDCQRNDHAKRHGDIA
jgi:hypothetical protein